MELKLNIYDGNDNRKIVKTYTADEYDITLGTLEDVIELVEGKEHVLDFNQKNIAWFKDVFGIAKSGFGIYKHLMKEIFAEVTDEELNHVNLKDSIKNVIKPMLSLSDFGLETTSKN